MTFGAQDETVAFLSRLDGGVREIVTTHISIVVLCETRAFKLKRETTLPYIDLATPQKRLDLCEREVALNRRTAPALYRGVRRVTREANGALAFDGDGEFVDAVVEMRRFDHEDAFDRLAAARRLTRDMIERLAATIARSHDGAPANFAGGGGDAMARVIAMNEASARAALLASNEALERRMRAERGALASLGPLLDSRRAAGKVRLCHGDLTLRNICLLDGEPTPFDCLEFSDELATIDVLYDLAFLLMDLWRANERDLANLALNRYLDRRDETDGLPLLPLFMSLRAMIRAHVAASQSRREEARDYFDLAGELLRPAAPRVVAIGGRSGSGKSSVAARLAARIGAPPGARVVNSDRLRKEMFCVAPSGRLPQAAYAPEISKEVYRRMFAAAKRAAASPWAVIVDAVFDRPQDREAAQSIARERGVPFHGFWLEADLERRAARVDARVGDVSDATRDVLAAQMRRDVGELRWTTIDAARDLTAVADDIFARVTGKA